MGERDVRCLIESSRIDSKPERTQALPGSRLSSRKKGKGKAKTQPNPTPRQWTLPLCFFAIGWSRPSVPTGLLRVASLRFADRLSSLHPTPPHLPTGTYTTHTHSTCPPPPRSVYMHPRLDSTSHTCVISCCFDSLTFLDRPLVTHYCFVVKVSSRFTPTQPIHSISAPLAASLFSKYPTSVLPVCVYKYVSIDRSADRQVEAVQAPVVPS